MADKKLIKEYTEHLRMERNAVALYQSLARAETDPSRSDVYRKLAETEKRHVTVWEEKLRGLGVTVPDSSLDWRTKTLGWLARRFGTAVVLPTVAAIEQGAGLEYDQYGAEFSGMATEERSHARIFGYLATHGQGLEGRAVAKLEGRHRSTGGNALRAGVLGANDGLLSNLSLVMGVVGAEMTSSHILITGLAGLLAGASSMAMGEWLSVQSSRELYSHQIGIEKAELAASPEEEKEELALIYQAKGLPAEEAGRLADRIISNPSNALDTLAREELGIDPDELGGSAWVASLTSFFLFAAGAIIPVSPFFFLSGAKGVVASAAASAVGLYVIGAAITLVTGRSALWSGFRQVLFGLAAAGITFGVGHLIGLHIGG